MADLNDPSEPAEAKSPAEPAVAKEAGKPAAAEEPEQAASAEEPVEPAAAEKPEEPAAAETPAAAEKPSEPEPEEATAEKPEEPAAEAAPAEEPAAGTEAEPGTVLPDSIVAGAAAPEVADSHEDSADPDGSEDEVERASAKPAKKPRKPLARPRPLVAALSLLLVVLLAAGVTLFVHNHRVSAEEASRAAALDTARQVATSLTTITPDNAAGQIDDLTKHSTGSFKDQIGGYSAMFQAVLKQGNVASRGTITAAGIEKMEGDAASAIVAVSALITSGQVPQGQPRTYRLLVSLQRSGDQWLAANVDFVQ